MSKHTPGPWVAILEMRHENDGPLPCVETKEGFSIADVWGSYEVGEANARLIAAAPELLEALEYALWAHHESEDIDAHGSAFNIMRAAIARARGSDSTGTKGETE